MCVALIGTSLPSLAHANPEGWSCPTGWYGTHDGCDCGCGKLDPDCTTAKADACEYNWNCTSDQTIRSQNWRCAGMPLSKPYPNTGAAEIPTGWTGTEEEFLDNDCSCGLGAFDPACDGPTMRACETIACTHPDGFYGARFPNPWNNWKCDGWWIAPNNYGANDGCDCGYGSPDPDCPDNRLSSCDYISSACEDAIDPEANWLCGTTLEKAALVPNNSYCAGTVDWDPQNIRVEELYLARINQKRAEGANCGSEGYFPPAEPLTMNPYLRCAARDYSRGPYGGYTCSHESPNGDGPYERAETAGYDAECLAEDMYCAGANTMYSVDDFMLSDGHCAALMTSYMNEVGVGISHYTIVDFGYRP